MKNPSEIARETLKLLAQRKLAPTPDQYAKIFAEISGEPASESGGAEQVLKNLAERLISQEPSAATGLALKKMLAEANWDLCLSEIEKVLPKGAEDAQAWPGLIKNLLRQIDLPHKGLTVTRKREGVDTVLARFSSKPEVLYEKLHNLIRSWSATPMAETLIDAVSSEAPSTTQPASPPSPATPALPASKGGEIIAKLAELLAQTLESTISAQPELTDEIRQLSSQVRLIRTVEQVSELQQKLRHLWLKVELRGTDKTRIQEGLVRLLRLLVENVGEMVEDEDWLHGQINALNEIISKPLDKHVIADAERSLREAIIKQSLLKKSLTDAKSTLKNLMTTFIDRLSVITTSTGDYHQKIESYSQKIAKTNNLNELGNLLEDIMQDTRIIQASALRSHEELLDTRRQVEEAEARIAQLEQELSEVSELVHQDQLTGALNRRGLDEAFERESTRVDRNHTPLCVALLDIDDFKRLNDTLGHQVGDKALVHLCNMIKETLRPSDAVARYGGEEFVIVLPDIAAEEASGIVERLQRELTKRFFMHENERVLVTFSAGVAQREEAEPQDEVIGRADKAMYQAKRTGKNRVVVAK
jgi:diguanylate cyclase